MNVIIYAVEVWNFIKCIVCSLYLYRVHETLLAIQMSERKMKTFLEFIITWVVRLDAYFYFVYIMHVYMTEQIM